MTVTAAAGQGRSGLLRDVAVLLAAIVLGRLLMASGAFVAVSIYDIPEAPDVLRGLCRWDCRWYRQIALIGYDAQAQHWLRGDGANWAFFPALPVAIAAAMALTGLDVDIAGLVVANLAFVGSVLLFHLVVRDLLGPPAALFGGAMMALWPFSVHASVPMSEALYLPLSMAAVHGARRGWWLAAGIAAAACSATRAVGLFVVVPMLMIAIREHGFWRLVLLRPGAERAALALGMTGIGLGLFMLHLHGRTGDALAFSHIQTAWGREAKWPWMMVYDALNPMLRTWLAIGRSAPHLVTAALALASTAVLIRRRLWPEAVLVLFTLGVALTQGATISLPRFSGALYPVVLAVVILADRPGWHAPALALSAAGLAAMSFLWASGAVYAM